MNMLNKLQRAAKRIKHDAFTVYFAALDSRTPPQVRVLALAIVAYALSPIDFIPDYFIVIGYLDDLILLVLGILLIIRSQPPEIIADSREKASRVISKPTGSLAVTVIVTVWMVCTIWFTYSFLGK
jgi:uncharacterized membrane protein YkvA (DUF1232 family)